MLYIFLMKIYNQYTSEKKKHEIKLQNKNRCLRICLFDIGIVFVHILFTFLHYLYKTYIYLMIETIYNIASLQRFGLNAIRFRFHSFVFRQSRFHPVLFFL